MTVFANGLEISSKKQGCKVIAAFPDTCFTPPQTPATPPGVPIPYPDFGKDSDLTSGTGTVKIGGEPVSQENSSKYSKCSGDEAGSAPKKGIITSKNTGAVYAQKWSMDVKFEGKGVVRFSDMATSNHSSNPGDSPPMVVYGGASFSLADCANILAKAGLGVHKHDDKYDNCNYKSQTSYNSSSPTQQSDHFPQSTCFTTGTRNSPGLVSPTGKQYKIGDAPCVCLEDGSNLATEHGRKSRFQKWQTTVWRKRQAKNPSWSPTYKDAKRADLNAMRYAKSPHLNRDKDGNEHPALICLELEMDKYFKDELGFEEDSPVSVPNQNLGDEKYAETIADARVRLR